MQRRAPSQDSGIMAWAKGRHLTAWATQVPNIVAFLILGHKKVSILDTKKKISILDHLFLENSPSMSEEHLGRFGESHIVRN